MQIRSPSSALDSLINRLLVAIRLLLAVLSCDEARPTVDASGEVLG